MDVKSGYQETEAGLLPTDWSAATIGQVIERLEAGASVNSEKDDAADFDSYPCVLKTGAAKQGSLDLRESKKVARRDLWRLRVALRKDTILISRMNTLDLVGESGYVDADYPNLFVPDRMWMTTLRPTVCPRWFSYLLTWQPVRARISASATGTSGSMKNISKPSLRAVRIPYPPAGEQRAIATALSDVDKLIVAQDQLTAKKRDIRQGAVQRLLSGKVRLPGFTRPWRAMTLGELGTCLRGVTYEGENDLRPYDTANTCRLLRANNVQDSALVANDIQFVNKSRVSDQQVLRANDIVICMANGSKELVGKAARFVIDDGYAYTFGAFMACFRTSAADAFPEFVFELFSTVAYRNWIITLLAGSSINNLAPSAIEALRCTVPEHDEQVAIAKALADMDAEIGVLEDQRDKMHLLKLGMMQALLTGRIRLV